MELFLLHHLPSFHFVQWLVGKLGVEGKSSCGYISNIPWDGPSMRGGSKKSHWLVSTGALGGAHALLGGLVASWAPGEWPEGDSPIYA